MCPSPAAVRRYPNVTLMAPGCGCNPFAAEAVTSLFEQQNWKFRRQKTLSTAGRAASNLHSAPRAQHVFCTQVGGSWPGPHRSTKEESIRINQFLRRPAAIVSRAEEVSLPQQSAWRKGGVNTPGKARHGTARRATPLAGFRRTCLGGFLFGPCMRPLGTRALARDSSSL